MFGMGAEISTETTHSKARNLLVGGWMFASFLLTICYTSVLLAMLMIIEYEETIDTLDDMLMSEIPLRVPFDTGMRHMLQTDPRERVQELAKKVEPFFFGQEMNPNEPAYQGVQTG